MELTEGFVIDRHGNRIGVFLSIDEYEKLLDELEELEAIRAYDDAKASGDVAISLEQAISEIEQI
jgi:hypothetical protein